VFPSFGVAVDRAAPPEDRGMAMGLYSACLDLALAVSGPIRGLVGSMAGLQSIFLASALLCLCAAPIALLLLRQQSTLSGRPELDQLEAQVRDSGRSIPHRPPPHWDRGNGHAVWLCVRFALSLRRVEEMPAARRIEVGHQVVRHIGYQCLWPSIAHPLAALE
jgi:MFS family permease